MLPDRFTRFGRKILYRSWIKCKYVRSRQDSVNGCALSSVGIQNRVTKMAILRLEDGTTYTGIDAINCKLSELQVQIEKLPFQRYLINPEKDRSLQNLFSQEILNLSQKQEILQALSPRFAGQQSDACTWCELIAVNLSSPHLYQLLAQGSRPHYYTSDLGLYLLAGECILGFLHPDGSLMELIVQAEEYIKVPARIRHWFSLSALLQVKAVRYFATAAKKINVPCSSN